MKYGVGDVVWQLHLWTTHIVVVNTGPSKEDDFYATKILFCAKERLQQSAGTGVCPLLSRKELLPADIFSWQDFLFPSVLEGSKWQDFRKGKRREKKIQKEFIFIGKIEFPTF